MAIACTTCLMPDGAFALKVGPDGVCNYCRYWEANRERYRIGPASEARLRARFEAVRGRYPYDAMVGLSGGKDSAYVLYRLTRHYGLKCLAVTYDNGFLTDYARDNIRRIVDRLGVEHVFFRPDWEAHKVFYRATLTHLGDPCVACAISGYFLAMKACAERRIPFFVHGRSPFQMFRNFYEGSPDVFIPLMDGNLQDYAVPRLRALYSELDRRIKAWLDRFFPREEDRSRVRREFFPDPAQMTDDPIPEFLGLFLFEPYDEEAIKSEMERAVGYRRPPGDGNLSHGDCMIHDAAAYLWAQVHGVSLVAPEVAVMLRHGAIDHAAARQILAQNALNPTAAQDSICRMCSRLEIEPAEFQGLLRAVQKSKSGKFDSH